MGISEKVCDRLKGAIRYSLSKNQYGDVTDEKIDDIRDEVLPLLMNLHKDKMLFDYAFSVFGDRMENKITVKLKVCLTPGGDMLDLGTELMLRNTTEESEEAFDRAMKGI